MARLSVEAGVAGAGCLRRHLYGGLHHLQVLPEPSSLHMFSKLLTAVFRIRIRIRIHMFLGLPDPDPSVIKQI